ncbi:aminopeptidase N [uncultured Friedmanniella sp.]|uniref:aminopeptidase N n=1 Tax=uncultured Friedmanniella sp. TaxID=335381 RepID=UPI0035CA39E0
MFPDNITRAEATSRSELLATSRYTVEIDLSGRDLDQPTAHFVSTSTVFYTGRGSGLTHVDLIAESVRSVTLDGVALDASSFSGSRLPLEVTPGEHELTVVAVCRYSRSGEGLHRFVDPADGRTYLYTQFEVADARRMFANFEQPDLKARFTTSAVAPQAWEVVSNGSLLSREPVGEGLVRASFSETEPVSTYLTALVAGDYAHVSGSYIGKAGELAMGVYCRQSLVDHLDADAILKVTTDGFDVFEGHFAFPYPFGKYDQIFVPEYNAGAMENIGCVVFRDEYIFRSRVTAASRSRRQDTILHELSHMWFGDLVTMRWWDDLWLKESFATWASNFAVSEQSSDQRAVWARFLSGFKTNAYRADQLSSTHPVAADMVDLEAVESNFDSITYAKGGSVLVQLVGYVGRDAFLAGLRTYFARHAFGNTSLADLLAALQESSDRDLSAWSAQWLEAAGVNTLSLELVEEECLVSGAAIRQTADPRWPTLRDHRVLLGLYALLDGELVRTEVVEVEVRGGLTPVPALVGRTRPDLVLVNEDDLTYAKARLDPASLTTAHALLPRLADPLSRAVLWQTMWDACRDALLPADAFADLVLRGLGAETDATVINGLLAQGATAVGSYSPPASRPETATYWQHGLLARVQAAVPGSDDQLALARALVGAARDDRPAELVAGWLEGHDVPEGLAVDQDLRWAVIGRLASLGRIDEAAIAAEEAADGSVTGQERAAGARSARPTAEAKAEAWRMAVDGDDIPNSQQSAICLSFWQRSQDDVLEPYVDRYFRLAEDISASRGVWATKGIALRKSALRNLFPWPTDQRGFLDRLDAWLAETEIGASVLRTIIERRDETVRALACQAVPPQLLGATAG